MEVTIGIRDVRQAVTVDVDITSDEVAKKVSDALEDDTPLVLTGSDGKIVIVPGGALGYVQISDSPQRRVGFGFA